MDALTMLRLQVEWGADEALDPDPFDRLRERRAPLTPPIPIRSVVPRPVAAAGSPAERAVAAAAAAETVAALRAAIAAFGGCALKDTATNVVLADGDIDAGILNLERDH